MRASDREKLLRQLVAAKEIDPVISAEVDEALKICGACRDNRNTVLHNAGGEIGEFGERALDSMSQICDDLTPILVYLRELQASITQVIFARGGMDTPIGDESFADELRPLIQFAAPRRPAKPRRIQKHDI